MRIGYPCINLGLSCRPDRTFRLASLSWERLRETVAQNLACLEEIIRWNAQRGLLFLRITSDLVPLASHPRNRYPWEEEFAETFSRVGTLVRLYGMRISMHPGQYTVLNSPRRETVEAAIADLVYHNRVLNLMGFDQTAKIQIHLGGQYGNKKAALSRFIETFRSLDPTIQERLVVEHDERLYTLDDCLSVSAVLGVPVVFDVLHWRLNPDHHSFSKALEAASKTWKEGDGIPIVDYSSPLFAGRTGRHALTLDEADFQRFLEESHPYDFDLMLEIKDKEQSALQALAIARSFGDERLVTQFRDISKKEEEL
ncbi:MAG: UV DNA damage repair endonuclease UvsE [Atribacterota bacterium]